VAEHLEREALERLLVIQNLGKVFRDRLQGASLDPAAHHRGANLRGLGDSLPVSFSRTSMASAVGSGTSSGRIAREIGSDARRMVVAASRLPRMPA
jgi:hypothetical protein